MDFQFYSIKLDCKYTDEVKDKGKMDYQKVSF